jgi:5-methylcytosine-specific restriction endonuclease McrBC regulatory subunit McrC
LAAASELAVRTRSSTTRAALASCEDLLSGVRRRRLTSQLAADVTLTRYEHRWERLVTFVRVLATSRRFNPVETGTSGSYSLVFSLHDLFESLVRKNLLIALRGSALRLRKVGIPERLFRRSDGHEVMLLRPDLVLEAVATSATASVADVKWKRLSESSRSFGVAAADAYQVATYMTQHAVAKGTLIYPVDEWMQPGWRERLDFTAGTGTLSLVAVDPRRLVDDDPLNREDERQAFAAAILAASGMSPASAAVLPAPSAP